MEDDERKERRNRSDIPVAMSPRPNVESIGSRKSG